MHNRPEVNHIPFRLKVWVGLAITLAIYRLLPKLGKFYGFQAIRPYQKIPPSQKRDIPDFHSVNLARVHPLAKQSGCPQKTGFRKTNIL